MKKMWILLIAVSCAVLYADEYPAALRYFNGKNLAFVYMDRVSRFSDDFGKTGLGKVWAEKEVQAFLSEPVQKMNALLKQGSTATGFDLKKIWDVCRNVEGSIGISLVDVDVERGFPKVVFVISGIRKEDQKFAAESVARLEELIIENDAVKVLQEKINGRSVKILKNTRRKNDPEICYSVTDDEILIGLTRDALSQALLNSLKKEIEPAVADALKFCGLTDRGGVFGFVDGRNVTELIGKVMEKERADDDEKRIFRALHTEDIISLSLHTSIKGPGFCNRFFVDLAEQRKGIGRIFKHTEVSPGLIREVPKDASSFSAAHVDLAHMWDAVMELMKKIVTDEEFQQVQAVITGFETQIGVKIRDELLTSLDGDILYYQTMPAVAMQVPGIVIKVKLRENGPLSKLINTFVVPMVANQGIEISDVAMGDYTARMIQIRGMMIPGLMPGFMITEKELIIASTRAGIQTALAPPSVSVEQNAEYQKLGEYVDEKKAASVSFTDVKKTFGTLYSLMPLLLNMPNVGRITGLEISKIPLTQTITQHLIGVKSVSRTVNGDMFTEIYGPVDYLTAGAAVGAGAGGWWGVTARRQMRHRAGHAAAGVRKKASLKEVYNACTIYALDHDGKLPEKMSDLYPDYVMDIKVFGGKDLTRETIDTKGKIILVKGVKLTDKGRKIILHERITPGIKTAAVIRVDGSVAEMTPAAIEAALQQQAGK